MSQFDYQLANGQSRTNPTSTGTISTNVLDMEQDGSSNTIITDDQGVGYLNIVVTSYSYTSGGTEGIILEIRTDDATSLATAKNGSDAGYEVIGAVEVRLQDIAAGMKISIPFIKGILQRYVGGWLRAVSTTLTGTIAVDMWIGNTPITANESLQKVPS